MIDFALGAVFGFALCFFLLCLAIATDNSWPLHQARQAVEQCEAELPRHLNCEAVITARVKEGEK